MEFKDSGKRSIIDLVRSEADSVVAGVLQSLGLDGPSVDFDNGLHVAILAAQRLRRRLRRLQSETAEKEEEGDCTDAVDGTLEMMKLMEVPDVLVVGSDGTGRDAFAQKLKAVLKSDSNTHGSPRVVVRSNEGPLHGAATALLCISVLGGARSALAEAVQKQSGSSFVFTERLFPGSHLVVRNSFDLISCHVDPMHSIEVSV